MYGRRLNGLCVAVAACLALTFAACGGSSDSDTADGSASDTYVGKADLSQFKPGAPQRTILSWWRAVQFANAGVAITYYAPQGAPKIGRLQSELAQASNQFSGIPTFSSVESHGDQATAYFFIVRPGSSSPPRAASVNLVKVHGDWLLADDGMLTQVVERVEAAQHREA